MNIKQATKSRGPSRDERFRHWVSTFNSVGAWADDPTTVITLIAPSLTGLFMWALALALWSTVIVMALALAGR